MLLKFVYINNAAGGGVGAGVAVQADEIIGGPAVGRVNPAVTDKEFVAVTPLLK